MRMRWLRRWITYPSLWIDVALFAAIGAVVILVMVVMLRWS
jgi:hypothetical protein